MAAHGGARRCGLALLTLVLLCLGAAPASHALATSQPVELAAGDSDVVLLNVRATATPRHAVHRSGVLGALPRRTVLAPPPVADAAELLRPSPELARARQFDSWIAERGPPVGS